MIIYLKPHPGFLGMMHPHVYSYGRVVFVVGSTATCASPACQEYTRALALERLQGAFQPTAQVNAWSR